MSLRGGCERRTVWGCDNKETQMVNLNLGKKCKKDGIFSLSRARGLRKNLRPLRGIRFFLSQFVRNNLNIPSFIRVGYTEIFAELLPFVNEMTSTEQKWRIVNQPQINNKSSLTWRSFNKVCTTKLFPVAVCPQTNMAGQEYDALTPKRVNNVSISVLRQITLL